MTTRVVVIAGVATGVGKTSVTLGLLEALRRRGLAVQAFKVGPDFIDPGFHARASGRPSYNLDGWMCGRERVLECVAGHATGADVVVVEGVMGCFDGFEPTSDDGSTAQVAKWLGAPVVLVLDAWAQARSAAAVVHGFESFDPALRVAGVIVNRAGSAGHGRLVLDAIRSACRAEPLGAIVHEEALALPERHLGLVTAVEGALSEERLRRLGDTVERSVDLDRLLSLATPSVRLGRSGPESACRSGRHEPAPTRRARIGVAHDAAFQFYYAENLDLLREAGADLVAFSPLDAPELPEVDGLYLGGGYPELHARRLAENVAMRRAIRRFADSGRPIYAECGGLMYLAESLEDAGGAAHPMVGVLPTRVRMSERRLALGYTEVAFTGETPLGPSGAIARGHEFHYSSVDPVPEGVARAYRITQRGAERRAEGYLVGRTLMSYVHLHFASNPALAPSLVAACAGA
jgi:cobyrinic acid a,c-diamide synthase